MRQVSQAASDPSRIAATFQQENVLPRRHQLICQRAPARTSADNEMELGTTPLLLLCSRSRGGGWSLMIFCARATRGLRRVGGEQPTILLARRGRTIRMCSLDARSEGQFGYPLLKRNEQAWREYWICAGPSPSRKLQA